jgi:hypothetical protein
MAQPGKTNKASYVKEFEALGRDKVRSDLMLGKFEGERKSAARMWIEQADAESWQSSRKAGGPARTSIFRGEAIKKYLPYIAGIAMVAMAFGRLRRMF